MNVTTQLGNMILIVSYYVSIVCTEHITTTIGLTIINNQTEHFNSISFFEIGSEEVIRCCITNTVTEYAHGSFKVILHVQYMVSKILTYNNAQDRRPTCTAK